MTKTTRTIEIERFLPTGQIDARYFEKPLVHRPVPGCAWVRGTRMSVGYERPSHRPLAPATFSSQLRLAVEPLPPRCFIHSFSSLRAGALV